MREDRPADRVERLIGDFGRFVESYDLAVPFATAQLSAHRETVALRSLSGSAEVAISNPEFVSSLRRTLIAWRLDVRGSRLVGATEFADALRMALPRITVLEQLSIDAELPNGTAEALWDLINSIGITSNDAKIVAGTKALHHLLPELVPPMDRAWTGKFFALHDPQWQGATQRRTFLRLFKTFVEIARAVDPQRYVTGNGWRTSRTKILDNALIGFFKAGSLEAADAPGSSTAITFHVLGYPPAKSEAKSMLSIGHSHATRVRLLLGAASDALRTHKTFQPIDEGEIALELVVHAPHDQEPWDATNYLGGVADVLEDKSRRGSATDHLDNLASIWLYRNDRQIKQISYRQQYAAIAAYDVTIRCLIKR